eukprot:g908.t1
MSEEEDWNALSEIMKSETKFDGEVKKKKEKEKIELRTTTRLDGNLAARRISELRRALHQSEILRQKSIKRTEAYKAECCKIRKILSKCEDELSEVKDKATMSSGNDVAIPEILREARSETSKLRSALNTTQAERDHYRTSYERLSENGSANQMTLMEEIKRLQVENGKMSALLSAKTRGLSTITAKSNETARHNEDTIRGLQKRCKILTGELKRVCDQRDDLLSERKRVVTESADMKRIFEENENKMKEMRNHLHGTEKDLQMANQIIESLHERVTAAETCGPRGALVSSFETQIRDLRDGFEKEKKILESKIENVESRERALIKARDRDVATANRKMEEATSRAMEMEKRLGLLVAGESDATVQTLRAENDTLRAKDEKLSAENDTLRAKNEKLSAENDTLRAQSQDETIVQRLNEESVERLSQSERKMRKSLEKETRTAKRLAGEWALGQLEHAQALESLRAKHMSETESLRVELTQREELECSMLRSQNVRSDLERSVLRSQRFQSRVEKEKDRERERMSREYQEHLDISRRELTELRSSLETACREANVQAESFESYSSECESLRDQIKRMEREESETLSSLRIRLAKSIQTCASLKSQIETQRIEFERVLRIEVNKACDLFAQQGCKKLDVLKSRLSTLSSIVSTRRRKVYKDVRTQTVCNESSNDMTTQTPRIERKDDVRVPTEPTPAASTTTTTSTTPKKRIEWIDNDLRYSVEDKDDVVVDVFRPEPSSLSFRTPPRVRRSKNFHSRNDDEDAPEMITPKIFRKSASIPCDSPETEAELFRKLQDISTRSIFSAPSTPTKVQNSVTTCYPEQLSPAQTIALMKRVLRVSIPYTNSSKEEEQQEDDSVARAFQLGVSLSRSQVDDTRRTYTFV